MNSQPTALVFEIDETAAIEAALSRVPGRGNYRVVRGESQVGTDGRDWADDLGPSREGVPLNCGTSPYTAVRALIQVMRDSSMGGHRYGSIERAGGQRVAEITHSGKIVIGLNPYRPFVDGKFQAWQGEKPLRPA